MNQIKHILHFGMYVHHYIVEAETQSFGIGFHHVGCEWYMSIQFWRWTVEIGYMFFEDKKGAIVHDRY